MKRNGPAQIPTSEPMVPRPPTKILTSFERKEENDGPAQIRTADLTIASIGVQNLSGHPTYQSYAPPGYATGPKNTPRTRLELVISWWLYYLTAMRFTC